MGQRDLWLVGWLEFNVPTMICLWNQGGTTTGPQHATETSHNGSGTIMSPYGKWKQLSVDVIPVDTDDSHGWQQEMNVGNCSVWVQLQNTTTPSLWDLRHHSRLQWQTRHRASTSMYSLTFRIRVATPAQYGRNGTASLQITSHTQQARRFYRWCVRA